MPHSRPIPIVWPLAAALLALPAPLAAQFTVPVPANADLAEGQHAAELPFGRAGFRSQIVVDGAAVAVNGAVLSGIRFRADRPSVPLGATAVPNVTISLSHTSLAPGQLAAAFAGNVTGTPAVVFQGTVQLPAQARGLTGPMPWDIAIPFAIPFSYANAMGHLLIDIVGNNPPGAAPTFYLDAGQQGGTATPFGHAGHNPSADALRLSASTGNSLEPLQIVPGGLVDYHATLSFTSPPGLLMLGFAGLPQPLDLGPFGAPTHFVFVAPAAYVGLAWTQTFIGFEATVHLTIPNQIAFVDQLLFAQPALFDATANGAGLLLGPAIETRIGDNQTAFPLQQLDAVNPAAATGTLLDFGFGPTSQFGAALIQLEGVFF